MSVDIGALKRGDILQLVSSSPYMTVRGFKPASAPNAKNAPRTMVACLLWSHRHGFVEKDFYPEELRFPVRREPVAEPAEDEGDDG